MKYKESKKILEIIDQNNSFVLFCHDEPDIDSIYSCLIMAKFLMNQNKKIEIYCQENLTIFDHYLSKDDVIEIKKSDEIDFSLYDVFFALDVNELKRFGLPNDFIFNGKVINIDHHAGDGFGDASITDQFAGSTCTLLYYLFKDGNVKIDKEILQRLLVGIISDTGVFHFSITTSPFIFNTVAEILDLGGDYQKALYLVEQFYEEDIFKYWAEGIQRINVDREHRFAYTTIPYDVVKKYEGLDVRTRHLADNFLRNITDTDFGIVMVGTEDGAAKLSVRTRTPGYYVLELAKQLGGGGHLTGGGGYVKEDTFEKSVEKVLEIARNYAKANKKT